MTVAVRCVKRCDPRLNRPGEIRPKAVECGIFSRVLNFDKCRPEAASDVISGKFVRPIIIDKNVKFCDPCLNHSREISPEAAGVGDFDIFFAITSDRK